MSPKVTILVIEDDADICDALASALEDHGYSVLTAANGREALDTLRSVSPSPRLILLDLMMPVMDGWEFRAAQTSDPAIAAVPVVIVSAHVDLRETAEQMGAAGWLKKPIDLDALLETVEARSG